MRRFMLCVLFFGLSTITLAQDAPGGMKLLPGYTHKKLQGIDSVVGAILKGDAPAMQYEIGRVVAPGGLRLGGDFTDSVARLPEAQRQWLREQTIGGVTFRIAREKTGRLLASVPSAGINFHAHPKTDADLADCLLMILSFAPKK